jgi:hypothetical protein
MRCIHNTFDGLFDHLNFCKSVLIQGKPYDIWVKLSLIHQVIWVRPDVKRCFTQSNYLQRLPPLSDLLYTLQTCLSLSYIHCIRLLNTAHYSILLRVDTATWSSIETWELIHRKHLLTYSHSHNDRRGSHWTSKRFIGHWTVSWAGLNE